MNKETLKEDLVWDFRVRDVSPWGRAVRPVTNGILACAAPPSLSTFHVAYISLNKHRVWPRRCLTALPDPHRGAQGQVKTSFNMNAGLPLGRSFNGVTDNASFLWRHWYLFDVTWGITECLLTNVLKNLGSYLDWSWRPLRSSRPHFLCDWILSAQHFCFIVASSSIWI